MYKIFIDIGHGGTDSGAINSVVKEKDMNLVVGLEVKRLLELNGFEVKCSRESDETVSLVDRSIMSNNYSPNIFISIHHNAGGGDGYEVIHSLVVGDDDTLAKLIGYEFEKIGQNKRSIYTRESTVNIGKEYYSVLRNTNCKCKLISEFCFIDNIKDYEIADTKGELFEEAKAIVNAICRFYGITPNFITIDELSSVVQDRFKLADETMLYLKEYKYAYDLLKKLTQ
jgi:N-acetylmuramoyl-L-alanine amidase